MTVVVSSEPQCEIVVSVTDEHCELHIKGDLANHNLPHASWKDDWPVINEAKALEQACGDPAFLYELLDDISDMRAPSASDLSNAFEQNDHQDLHEKAHSIKGAALNLQLPALACACFDVETVGKWLVTNQGHSDFDRAQADRQSRIDRVETEFARFCLWLQTKKDEIAAL